MLDVLRKKIFFKVRSIDNKIEGVIKLNNNNDVVFVYRRIGDKELNSSTYLNDFIKTNDLSKFEIITGELAE